MEARGADGELRQLPQLKFTGDNVREFLDKFPQIATYWQVWGHISTDEFPAPRNQEELIVWRNIENLALNVIEKHVSTNVWKVIREYNSTARLVYKNLSSCFLSTKFENVVNIELELLKINKSESERLVTYFAQMDALAYEL